MSFCEDFSFKIKFKPSNKIRCFAIKQIKCATSVSSTFKLKAKASVIYSGFVRGRGPDSLINNFGSNNFANSPDNAPSLYLKSFRGNSAVKLHYAKELIKRSADDLPDTLFNTNSQDYIDYGKDALSIDYRQANNQFPIDIYSPQTSSNSSAAYIQESKISWSLATQKKRLRNSRFIARASIPVNNLKANFNSHDSRVKAKYFEKLHGFFSKINSIENYQPVQKMYPIRDLITTNNNISFISHDMDTENLYSRINEGVFVGNITQNAREGYIISDDDDSYITPSSIYTEGKFKYVCEVSPPTVSPIESFFFLRASSPLFNYETDIPPEYKVSNITLEDPSGNLIVKYKDFAIRGEQDYDQKNQYHFVTYVSEPEINYAALNTWHPKYPILNEASGYKLSLEVDGDCFYKSFTQEFNKGFLDHCDLDDRFVPSSRNDHLAIDGSPISTQTNDYYLRPTNALRISAIELANRGLSDTEGLLRDSFVPMYSEVVNHGTFVERIIQPKLVLGPSYNNDIYPTGIQSVWKTSPDLEGNTFTNHDENSTSDNTLRDRLINRYVLGHISLDSIVPSVEPSGKLQLLYQHEEPFFIKALRGGAFSFGNKYSNSLNTSVIEKVTIDDSFFVVEEIFLRIRAKKAPGTDSFPIDVVGYSDDQVLFITSQKSGFLQNSSAGYGNMPQVSGFHTVNELSLSSESISDKSAYYSSNIASNAGGDHYYISNDILVDSTEFKTYDIPLKIYKDKVDLGFSKDYSMSSYFESLYLDIYPIPSGASIAKADLIVKHKPAGSLPLEITGFKSKEINRRISLLSPSKKKPKDRMVNSNNHLSLIENIPQAYSSKDTTLKTNYSRRWRGSSGLVSAGPFDNTAFGFAFSFPQLDQPFPLGYIDFHNVYNDKVFSNNGGSLSGVFSHGDLSQSIVHNVGMRFKSPSLFASNSNTPYNTIDWTYEYPNDPLYGQILDSFDKAVRVSGVDGYLNFGNVPSASGFAIFTRFSPDENVSGVNYNLWNSGVIFQKQDAGEQLEYGLRYNNGYLEGFALDSQGNTITITDPAPYHVYQYPLSVVLSYNSNNNQLLELYTQNEIVGSGYTSAQGEKDWPILRDSDGPFVMHSGNSNLTFGYSEHGGVGFNCFISDIGISKAHEDGGGNLVKQDPYPPFQQDSIYTFFSGHTHKFWEDSDPNPLWSFVDEPTDSWNLGDFKYCDFSNAYKIMSSRSGKDFVYHTYNNDNLTYADRIDRDLPASVNASGLAYHSQIENDMLRIHLDGNNPNFYAVPPRLSKNLPRGYLVDGDAIEVSTVIQQSSDQKIVWDDGKVGAKVIVSLYTPSKESDLFPSVNYGLINRSTHYIAEEDCWTKIYSRLKLEDIKDRISEPWGFFDPTVTSKELRENYFSREIDEMFIQYDVVYPSGSYSTSKIKLHSLDVHLNNAFISTGEIENQIPLYASGDAFANHILDLYTTAYYEDLNNQTYLYTSGIAFSEAADYCYMYTSGVFNENSYIPLYTLQAGTVSSDSGFGLTTNHFGSEDDVRGLNLFIEGGYSNISSTFPITTSGYYSDIETIDNNLSLFTFVDGFSVSHNNIDIFMIGGFEEANASVSSSLNISMLIQDSQILTHSDSINLLTEASPFNVSSQIPLYLYHIKPLSYTDGVVEFFRWNSENYGTAIIPRDNEFASVPANDEIRGVNTVCYGGCDSDANIACQEQPLITHDTLWYDPECVDGGVARSLTVFSNDTYDRKYYGIRKFENLIPQSPYRITIKGKTAGDKVLEVPREISEWEYGTNNDTSYSGIKINPPEGNIDSNNFFGKSVTVLKDMLAVGCPFENSEAGVQDVLSGDGPSYTLQDNGKIYIYRKAPEPSGNDWTDQLDKSPFTLEQELVLPTGWRRDYFYTTQRSFFDDDNNLLPFQATVRNWKNFGEGRQLGHSIASAERGNNSIIVAGGPGTKWTRAFQPVQTTPVSIALFVFNNELVTNPIGSSWEEIKRQLKDIDILYRYFSDPPVEFDIKIILCEPMLGGGVPFTLSEDFNYPQPDFVKKYVTNRHYNFDYNSQEYKDQEAVILQELIDIYHENFPLNPNALSSGIPPLFGIYIDNSRSLGKNPLGYFESGPRSGAINKFIDYVNVYSQQNGLVDLQGEASTPYVRVTLDTDEDWIQQSIRNIKQITDIDTLKSANKYRLFADNIGTFNSNASEFNEPPPSGGAVFIFEKKGDSSFEIVQAIESTSTYTDDVSDRFGHDVAISENGKTIVVGSPFCNDAIQVWEYDPSYEENLMMNISHNTDNTFVGFLKEQSDIEIQNATFGEAYSKYREYQQKTLTATSLESLRREIYFSLSESLRFSFTHSLGLNPYRLIKNISYESIFSDTGGSWSTFYNNHIPTARLGYSVDVNEDGTLIAAGSPTDSFGERDATITWFRYNNKFPPYGEQTTPVGGENWQWQNYTNAGAVRLFESRDYYPHYNKAVEYYKFGNLHEDLSDISEDGFFFDAMSNGLNSKGISFSRTSFSEDKKIPQDAGMAMIITPAIDASSEEIINNIREWLAYGDRNLVLVGNDPKWESGGVYQQSNNIINNILERLDINLRIYPARNSYEALIEDTNVYYNVQQSFVPEKTTYSIASPFALRGYGAGDIRFYDPGKSDIYKCTLPHGTKITVNGELAEDLSDPFVILESIDQPDKQIRKKIYRELHNFCEMPIVHEGDLRAKYLDQCVYRSCTGDPAFLDYEHNLAFLYKSHTTCNDWGCTTCDEICPPVPSVNYRDASEPIPVMAAYESVSKTVHVPAIPEREVLRSVISGYKTETHQAFGEVPYSGIDFMWSETSGNYTSLEYNINGIISNSLFYNPDEYNEVDAILQAKASTPLSELENVYDRSDKTYFIAEENFESFKSSVVLIAGTLTESREVLLSSNADVNLNMYFNILAKDEFGSSKVAQVGGFTNRASYRDGFPDSDIQQQMLGLGIDMSDVDVSTSDLYNISKSYDVAWIANTDQYPSDQDIENIKRFLSLGNKKLIITYGQDPASTSKVSVSHPLPSYMINAAKVAGYLCEKLGLSMKPLFLDGKNRYASRKDSSDFLLDIENSDISEIEQQNNFEQIYSRKIKIDNNSYVSSGYGLDSKIQSFEIDIPPCVTIGSMTTCTGYHHEIIPIDKQQANSIAYFDISILDIKTDIVGIPQLHTGITKVTFEVPEPREDVPEDDDFNLFRIFVEVSSESSVESEPINFYIANCATRVNGPFGLPIEIKDLDDNYNVFKTKIKCGLQDRLVTRTNKTYEYDIQLPPGVGGSLEMFFTGLSQSERDDQFEPVSSPSKIRTNRLVSISGVRTPVKTLFGEIPIYELQKEIIPPREAYSYETPVIRQISTSSDKYCIESNSDICAERIPFGYGDTAPEIADGPIVVAQAVYHQAGFPAGHNKSRVTVISDPSLIQGASIISEDKSGVNNNVSKFLSSLYPYTFFGGEEYGKQYQTSYKIISPERTSPSRMINAYPENSGLNYRFGNYQSNELSLDYYSDEEGKKQITPVPPKSFVAKPFNSMTGLLSSYYPFNDPPKAPQLPPYEFFLRGELVNGMNQEEYEEYWYRQQFDQVKEYYASDSKFNDYYNGYRYRDAGFQERIPEILRQEGIDHLDLEVLHSGYPGDLFGYKVKLHKDKLYIGSPFTPYFSESITNWEEVVSQSSSGIYGAEVGFNGGAGAVYVLEKTGLTGEGYGSINGSLEKTTGLPWEIVQKFRPEEISVGFSGMNTSNSSSIIGPNSYDNAFLNNYGFVPDMFGSDIDLAGDMLAISAPGHNFDTFIEEVRNPSGCFIRKEFNNQFDIPQIVVHDLANEQERIDHPLSGVTVINHGSVFTYENKISDWGSKKQEWTPIQKIARYHQGLNSRDGNENLFLGNSIAIDRARRNDGDYILAIGAKNHQFTDELNQVKDKSGSVYAFDGMLRKVRPAFSHPRTYIAGRVYGEYQREIDYTTFFFRNDNKYDYEHEFQGRVISNIYGEIFIEVSGQDFSDSGYSVNRPFIESVEGAFLHGIPTENYISLFSDAKNPTPSSSLNLYTLSPSVGNVYNNVDLFNYCAVRNSGNVLLYSSGVESGFTESFGDGIAAEDSLNITYNIPLVTRGRP